MPKGSGGTSSRCPAYRASGSSSRWSKPDVDLIDGLSPAISSSRRRRDRTRDRPSGTVTEIYDYLRLLFANIGVPHCPNCDREISSQSLDRILELVKSHPSDERVNLLAPDRRGRKGEFKKELATSRARDSRAQDRRPVRRARRRHQARPAQEPQHRRPGRSAHRQAGHRAPDVGFDRARDEARDDIVVINTLEAAIACSRAGLACPTCGISIPGNHASRVLVQLAARRLPGMPGARRGLRLRSGAHRPG
jgi:excinuclease ABC subunit A